jgi:DNA-binding response OmpR family regulator
MTATETAPRILIIDDQMDSVALLLSYFKGKPLDILVALGGKDGLRKAVVGRPDAILLDVAMPDIDGFAVCQRLKADPRTAAIPVIFLSANTTVAHKLEGFTAGGVDYIDKPFWVEEVLARVFVHLKIKRRVEHLQTIVAGEVAEEIAGESPRETEQSAGKAAHNVAEASPPVTLASRDHEIVATAIAQLQHAPAEWLGLDSLARRVGTHEKKLTELFRQQFGLTVYEYLAELRLENARRQLADSHLQIQLIADQAGYSNASDFSRAFRRHYGIAPRQYRQACTPPAQGKKGPA